MTFLDWLLLIVAQAITGWLIADLVGGILHWMEDRVLTEQMPVLGRYVVGPNRRHHEHPMEFIGAGFVARNGTTWLAATAVSLVWIGLLGPSIVWAFATIGGLLSSQVHWLAHQPGRGGRVVRIAQEIGLLQSVAHHAGHHRPPSDRRYCVLTGWLNPVLDGVGLWAALERLSFSQRN